MPNKASPLGLNLPLGMRDFLYNLSVLRGTKYRAVLLWFVHGLP